MDRSTTPPKELARGLAELARLRLEEGEAELLGEQLVTVLGYIRSLESVDVEGVPEYSSQSPDGSSGLRLDDASSPLAGDPEAILAGVPKRRGSQVAVPRFKD